VPFLPRTLFPSEPLLLTYVSDVVVPEVAQVVPSRVASPVCSFSLVHAPSVLAKSSADTVCVPASVSSAVPLMRSATKSGFRYVNRRTRGSGYDVRLARDGKRIWIGKYATPEEGAVSVALWLQRRAENPVYAKPTPLTATEAIAVAAASGLTLVRRKNATGFRHVYYEKRINRYQAKPILNGKPRCVGYFDTPEEAALRVAQTPGFYAVGEDAADSE
jgi:hypothetical protein